MVISGSSSSVRHLNPLKRLAAGAWLCSCSLSEWREMICGIKGRVRTKTMDLENLYASSLFCCEIFFFHYLYVALISVSQKSFPVSVLFLPAFICIILITSHFYKSMVLSVSGWQLLRHKLYNTRNLPAVGNKQKSQTMRTDFIRCHQIQFLFKRENGVEKGIVWKEAASCFHRSLRWDNEDDFRLSD